MNIAAVKPYVPIHTPVIHLSKVHVYFVRILTFLRTLETLIDPVITSLSHDLPRSHLRSTRQDHINNKCTNSRAVLEGSASYSELTTKFLRSDLFSTKNIQTDLWYGFGS